MIETFTWCPRINAQSETTFRVKKAQFGDGYTQTAGDGLNHRSDSWQLEFVGGEAMIEQIVAFFDRHGGHKFFLWKPPLRSIGFFRCEQYKVKALGGNQYAVTTTFIEAFSA
ncbi:phage tail protein [Providencia alcalifaciens]|uniref:Phage minor tail protein n=1 Tax=Providencia alcalifaciens DSM 30120 TaxID=520999 RepID=B6XBT1_9GAMM|nr:phage tail protein [Providencia alcalifaciens]ATG18029.1 phage tail protein [Providencia alcalifaciens]EEB47083.1 phage minor tail protein [Providencia alcalifaciens DSM 30120]